MIGRAVDFRRSLERWWGQRRAWVFHARSIFESYWVARDKRRYCKWFVFEFNGLPSIELKYHYPAVADDRELLGKLRHQEDVCLAAADQVVTVSEVNRAYLIQRGVADSRIAVIPNGVDPEQFGYRRPQRMEPGSPLRVLYAGTMSAWQGVHLAVEAAALYQRDAAIELTLVGSHRRRQKEALMDQAEKLGIAGKVNIMPPVSTTELVALHHAADVILAPLTANDRNLQQGCCPLKVIEAMACGTPLVASDLPVVRALARAGQEAVLVRPGSAKAIKDGLVRLVRDPHLGPQLSAAARRRVKQHFTWERAQAALLDVYARLERRTCGHAC